AAAAFSRPPHALVPHTRANRGAARARWRRQDDAGALARRGLLSADTLYLHGRQPAERLDHAADDAPAGAAARRLPAACARAGGAKCKGGGRPLVHALGGLNSLIEQGVRYRVGAYHRRRGRLVVFDRYAAASLAAVQQDGALHKRLRRWATRLLCPPPDMVVY